MPQASLSFSPRPELVRIARMMSVSLARRSGVPEGVLDEVRIAVGEAASRAVRVHEHRATDEPVRLTFTEDARGYEVEVRDAGDSESVPDVSDRVAEFGDAPFRGAPEELEMLPAGLDLAVVAGFVDDLDVVPDPAGGTLVRLRWTR